MYPVVNINNTESARNVMDAHFINLQQCRSLKRHEVPGSLFFNDQFMIMTDAVLCRARLSDVCKQSSPDGTSSNLINLQRQARFDYIYVRNILHSNYKMGLRHSHQAGTNNLQDASLLCRKELTATDFLKQPSKFQSVTISKTGLNAPSKQKVDQLDTSRKRTNNTSSGQAGFETWELRYSHPTLS